MPITICSSPNHSPTLPTVSLSSIPAKSSLKTPHHLHPPAFLSSSKLSFDLGLVSNDVPTIGLADEAMALANAAANALGFPKETQKILELGEGGDGVVEREWKGVFGVRRKRRRKRRQGLGIEEKGNGECEKVSFRSSKSGYLTRREEAEYCMCLKEEAKVEAARRRLLETSEHFPTSNQVAKAIGMSKGSIDKILCDGRESRERITCSYRRLVVSIASSYQGRGLSLQDLIQEGSIGLLRGAERFDPERGNKMSTYVYWWIRQAITKAIANKSRMIRLPGSMCEKVPKIAEANTSLSNRLHRFPSHDEIAEVVNMDVSRVRLVIERSRAPISLDHAMTSRGCMTLQEIIQGPDETAPTTMLEKQLMKREIETLLETLHEREAQVLRLHYGLNGETPRSFQEIGKQLKLSRERVRQINNTALSKLQQSSMADNLKFYLM